jgi:hypothetical protein
VGISIGSLHQIFAEKVHMCRISAKFVPRLLADYKEENRVEFSQELLASANGIENFLKNIITGDGKWVYEYKGGPKSNQNFVIKNCVFIFIVESPSKYCPFDAMHRSKRVFHFSKQMKPFNAPVVFSSPLPRLHRFSFEHLFHWEE